MALVWEGVATNRVHAQEAKAAQVAAWHAADRGTPNHGGC